MESALRPLAEHLTCEHCQQALRDRIKNLVIQWSVVKVGFVKFSEQVQTRRLTRYRGPFNPDFFWHAYYPRQSRFLPSEEYAPVRVCSNMLLTRIHYSSPPCKIHHCIVLSPPMIIDCRMYCITVHPHRGPPLLMHLPVNTPRFLTLRLSLIIFILVPLCSRLSFLLHWLLIDVHTIPVSTPLL